MRHLLSKPHNLSFKRALISPDRRAHWAQRGQSQASCVTWRVRGELDQKHSSLMGSQVFTVCPPSPRPRAPPEHGWCLLCVPHSAPCPEQCGPRGRNSAGFVERMCEWVSNPKAHRLSLHSAASKHARASTHSHIHTHASGQLTHCVCYFDSPLKIKKPSTSLSRRKQSVCQDATGKCF